jgi:hypothetical protein
MPTVLQPRSADSLDPFGCFWPGAEAAVIKTLIDKCDS